MIRTLLSTLFLMLSAHTVFGQNSIPQTNAKSFPTNIQSGEIKELKKFDGKTIAYDGTIEKIENSRNNTPFYKLKIDTNNYLWTVLMFKNETNKVGDKIRIIGYLRLAEANQEEKKYLDTKYMVIAFGLVDFKNSSFLFVDGAKQQRQEWMDGKIPNSK